jgi:hypothetical protein
MMPVATCAEQTSVAYAARTFKLSDEQVLAVIADDSRVEENRATEKNKESHIRHP